MPSKKTCIARYSVGLAALLGLVAVAMALVACSASTPPANAGGQVPDPTPIVNAPNLHWINRDPVCTASAVGASAAADAAGPVAVVATPGTVACATIGPAPAAADVAAASPLEVATLSVPISATGTQRVALGKLTLPDGYYASTALTLANAASGTYTVQGLHVELEPQADGRPPMQGSVVGRSSFSGPEPFAAWLVFDVVSFKQGATLEITGLSVR